MPNMSDHDQRFKTLIQEFFGDFLALFFAEWAERLDCAAVEWLHQEVFPNPPEGARRVLDLVGKLPARQAVPGQRSGETESWLALVHIEIESPDTAAPLRSRLFHSYVNLRDKYVLPVLPIPVFLRVGLDGIGIDAYEELFWEFQTIKCQYLYVGLPALDGLQYVQGDNWLGVALSALMRIPRARMAWLGAEALRRITEAPLTGQQRYLLGECVQAYLPLDDEQKQEFHELLAGESYRGVQAMNTTWFEQGLEKGIEKGYRQLLQEQLAEQFGSLSPAVLERVQQLPAERLSALARALLRAQSLRELGLEE
ncbi:MAG TPA: DUF4351 domain-containing protein [Gemmataceae bacterium]|nr:DUF4351 domain-containing protein [Gemmataceae bacterium]